MKLSKTLKCLGFADMVKELLEESSQLCSNKDLKYPERAPKTICICINHLVRTVYILKTFFIPNLWHWKVVSDSLDSPTASEMSEKIALTSKPYTCEQSVFLC